MIQIPYEWLEEAAERIAPHIVKTPLTYDPYNDLYLKWENHQATGSFKLRGALNKVLSLPKEAQQRGLVAASAGNHGQGLAVAGGLVGAPVTIFASENAVPAKIEAMRALGAELRLVPGGYGEAEQAALQYTQETGATWVSPYNDRLVIAGQGTVAMETRSQLPALDSFTWVTPVGGGGLASGMCAALHPAGSGADPHRMGDQDLIGVQSEASPFAYTLFHAGRQADTRELPSLADGLAGPVEEGSITIPILLNCLKDLILVSEEEIAWAIAYAWERYQERLEGSAATALAAVLSGKVYARPAVIILSGGNIQPEVHARVIAGQKAILPTDSTDP